MTALKIIVTTIACALALHGSAYAQTVASRGDGQKTTATSKSPTVLAKQNPRSASTSADQLVKQKLNAWTVGLAGGLIEGAPLRFAYEMARVVDDGDNLHVLPIVTRGPQENVEALLYLKGVDAAVINSDALDEFKALVPDIQNRINYVLSLFHSELHVFVRPDIKSLKDLEGKRVNFNTPGTAAAYSGPIIFDRLNIKVEKTFIPHPVALEQMRKGEMAAVVFVTSKPIDAFARSKWEPGFRFLPVEYGQQFEDHYLPASLTAADYPGLIAPGERVQTIAVPTILAAYNWRKNTDRYERLARFVDHLFGRIEQLQEPGFHPKWKDVNVNAEVPGLERSAAAQEWLDRAHGTGPDVAARRTLDQGDLAQIRDDARVAAGSNAEAHRLFREFMEWRRQRR
jgi:TRAP-type uncharacterized transport system substrate-binding protein